MAGRAGAGAAGGAVSWPSVGQWPSMKGMAARVCKRLPGPMAALYPWLQREGRAGGAADWVDGARQVASTVVPLTAVITGGGGLSSGGHIPSHCLSGRDLS